MLSTDHQAATNPAAGAPSDARLAMAYTEHATAIRRSVLRIVRDPDAADDIVADAFTRLLIEAQRDRWPEQVRPWLYRVTWNLAMSRGRHQTVAARVERQMRAGHRDRLVDSPESLVLRREVGLELGRAVDALSPDARTAVLLAAEGFDGNAIAATIGRSNARPGRSCAAQEGGSGPPSRRARRPPQVEPSALPRRPQGLRVVGSV